MAHLKRPHRDVEADREAGPGALVFIRVHGWRVLGFTG